jgi:hypothetical protein
VLLRLLRSSAERISELVRIAGLFWLTRLRGNHLDLDQKFGLYQLRDDQTYELGTPAAFDVGRFNGRPLGDDVMDVMLTLAANKPLEDGAVPDRSRIRGDFPYFGEPYSRDEQKAVKPVTRPPKK